MFPRELNYYGSNMMEVKVIRVPGRTATVEVPDSCTIGEALNEAGVTLESGEACKLNGATASLTDVLTDGDKVIVAKGAKGNS